MGKYSIPLKDYEAAVGITGVVDVIRDYKWHTGLNTDMPVNHMPRIILHEFELANSALWAQANRIASFEKTFGDNPYASMYACKKTGLQLILPYLSDFVWKTSISWEPVEVGGNSSSDSDGGILGSIGSIFKTATDFIDKINHVANQLGNSAPAEVQNAGFEWQQGEVQDIQTKFYLINTNSTPKEWIKNYRMCQYLITSCLHDQMNTTKATPPPIYTMYIPGMRYAPATVISELEIKQIGSVMPYKVMKEQAKMGGMEAPEPSPPLNPKYEPSDEHLYIPDAWEITISFKDLVMASRQTHLFGMNPNRYNVQALTTAGGTDSLDEAEYGVYMQVPELSEAGYSNDVIYEKQNGAALFDLMNGTQESTITDG